MLPLLLQISLALFFAGLCFFTADIDPVIGFTTLPLVCAWAFLFGIVTISPVFSARCPYKTPALSAITTALRVHVWYNARHYARGVFAILLVILLLVFRQMLKLIRGTFGIWKDFVRAYEERFNDMIGKIVKAIIGEPREEEVESLNKATNDLAILVAADAVQANLELDLVIMEDALKQSNPKWDEVVNFLVQIIGNRIPLQSQFAKGLQTGLIDCRLLSTRTQAGIRGFLTHYVIDNNEFKLASSIQEIGDKPSWDSLSPYQQWTICVFLSLCEPDVSGRIPDVLHPLLAAWFDFILRDLEIVDNGIRDGGIAAIFTSLCLWINLGHTTRSLPQGLYGIRLILSDMLYELKASHDAKDQQGYPTISKTLGRLASTAARNFGNIVFSDYWKKDTEMLHSKDRCNPVLALCRIAEYMGDVGLYKEVFTPFVKESFLQRSYAMVEGILRSLFGLPFSSDESWHRSQRTPNCLFLLEIAAESQSSEGKFIHCQSAACTLLYLIPFDQQRTHTLLMLCVVLHWQTVHP